MFTKLIHFLFSLPITVFVNFKVLPFSSAIHLPILIDYRTKFRRLKYGCILISNNKFASIKIGWGNGSVGNFTYSKNYIYIYNGKLIFDGNAQFAMGVTLRCDNGGIIHFGNNFTANQNFTCFSNTNIIFGDDVLCGWNVNVRDSDGHDIYNENEIMNPNQSIIIGKHCWLSAHVDILKGSKINDGCIVGFRSLVTKKFEDKNAILGGVPAKIIKTNISWKK